MIHGILNIKKEAGFTSHDVVAKLRGIVHQKKIGHTGTLDPAAVGVLPVCLGKGTKLCDLIADWDKTYEAVLLLGRETDTEDTTGTVTREADVCVNEAEIREIIDSFVGHYDQIPPMYSAKKRNGKKLYELARAGITVEREPCPVFLSAIDILKVELPYVTFRVSCSKGTYIRSLCRDIGAKAGCGGCMASLVRTRVSSFLLEDALPLSAVEKRMEEGTLLEELIAIDSIFPYPQYIVSQEEEKRLYNGNPISLSACRLWTEKNTAQEEIVQMSAEPYYRVYDEKERFIGIYQKQDEDMLKPYKLFFDFS